MYIFMYVGTFVEILPQYTLYHNMILPVFGRHVWMITYSNRRYLQMVLKWLFVPLITIIKCHFIQIKCYFFQRVFSKQRYMLVIFQNMSYWNLMSLTEYSCDIISHVQKMLEILININQIESTNLHIHNPCISVLYTHWLLINWNIFVNHL